jgi:hypothetical protein
LSQRIAKGAITVGGALPIAKQSARSRSRIGLTSTGFIGILSILHYRVPDSSSRLLVRVSWTSGVVPEPTDELLVQDGHNVVEPFYCPIVSQSKAASAQSIADRTPA